MCDESLDGTGYFEDCQIPALAIFIPLNLARVQTYEVFEAYILTIYHIYKTYKT